MRDAWHGGRVPLARPRSPVVLEQAVPDPALVARLVVRHAPYRPVQRYFASAQEMAAMSENAASRAPDAPMAVGPVFRGDWAYDRPLVEGVEPILGNPAFVAAARRLFDAAIVRPHIVYVNLSLPMPCGDGGHTDVPAFRGVDRTRHPIWLLTVMGRSGLFERWRVPIATAVAWFYAGAGGEFTYWPDGPDRPPRTWPPRTNTAIVGDNDVMFHRVEAVGGPADVPVRGLTLDSTLEPDGADGWVVRDGGRTVAHRPATAVRVSLSWKAQVFADEAAARTYDEHRDDLTLDAVVDTFLADLRSRGVPVAPPADPLHDPAFVATLRTAYHVAPTVYPAA